MTNPFSFVFWIAYIWDFCLLSLLYFVVFEFCLICILSHLHFVLLHYFSFAFCYICIMSHLHFVLFVFRHVCIMFHLHFVIFALCRFCILSGLFFHFVWIPSPSHLVFEAILISKVFNEFCSHLRFYILIFICRQILMNFCSCSYV